MKLRLGFLLLAVLPIAFCDETTVENNVLIDPTPTSIASNTTVLAPRIKYLHYDTEIKNRYAITSVTSNVANPSTKAQEVNFALVLPETAFISGFIMTINKKDYKAYVKEKEAAKQDYDAAVSAGLSAAHIQQSVRDSNRFQVSVNVEAEGKVTFNLTYEELLSRTLGVYTHTVNVNPGQIVKDLKVAVRIEEPVPITKLDVQKFKTKNEITTEKEDDRLAVVDKPSPNSAYITWSPTTEQQIAIEKDGVSGQLVVEYDVDRTKSSQILVDEGYFVHFFTPNSSVPSLPKHIVFVLDVSGSMMGRKIEQLKEAMLKILNDLNEKDYFSIVLFSSDVIVWAPHKSQFLFKENTYDFFGSDNETEAIIKGRSDNEIIQATPDNVKVAKEFVDKIKTISATNIMGGLREGIDVVHKGQKIFGKKSNKASDLPQPIIVFLTDGEPNVEESNPNEIIKKTVELNDVKVPIFGLAFGNGADFQFLRKLSLKNSGFARNIYEASDASLQLNNFYKEISSPLMTDVEFKYLDGQVENGTLTKRHFPILFRGSEIVVAGRLHDCIVPLSFELRTDKNSDSTIDYKSSESIYYPMPRPCIPPPVIIPHPPAEANRTFGHLEKLWGYLTIKQLLDKDASNNGPDEKKNSTEKEQALKLALKYGFVTPLTSLVVVKPNNSDATVEPEKASKPAYGGYSAAAPMAASAFSGPPGAYYSHHTVNRINFGPSNKKKFPQPVYLLNSASRSRGRSRTSSNSYGQNFNQLLSRPRPHLHPFKQRLNAPTSIQNPAAAGGAGAMVAPMFPPQPAPMGGQPFYISTQRYDAEESTLDSGITTTVTPPLSPLPQIVPLDTLKWLNNYKQQANNSESFPIDVPTFGNFTVKFNETDISHGQCSVQGKYDSGNCRHLQYCPLSTFVDTINDYVPYFCEIKNSQISYAGVCCPNLTP